jgi:signal transduction histidine kinase
VVFQGNDKYQLEFKTEFKGKIIPVDKDQMVQVLNNLIKNAIQSFQNRGHGKIQVILEKNEDKKVLIVSVKDDGCGIDPENKKRIFIPRFTTKSTGSGIGLSLVKQIIENHGGEVSFSSKESEGSVFSFSIPD